VKPESPYHDYAVVISESVVEALASLIPESTRNRAKSEVYRRALAGFECMCIQQARSFLSRTHPSEN
jgi:hypothetical protein